MTTAWTPLSAREATEPFTLRENVPASLEGALRDWIYFAAAKLTDNGQRLMIKLDLVLPQERISAYNRAKAQYRAALKRHEQQLEQKAEQTQRNPQPTPTTPALPSATAMAHLSVPTPPPNPRPPFIAYDTPTSRLLDIIDALLDLLPYKPPPAPTTDPVLGLVRRARRAMQSKEREQLQQLLTDGHMAYRVRADGRGLERQVSAISTAAALSAAATAEQVGYPTAATRLTQAWNKIYALKPDPSGAYHDAVRAVEAVACPLFLPTATTPTLGTVLSHLDQAPSKYQLVIADNTNDPADIHAVTEMIRTLWHGHRDRHEGGPTSGTITPQSAQAAVSLAVCIVHLLSTGCIQTKQ